MAHHHFEEDIHSLRTTGYLAWPRLPHWGSFAFLEKAAFSLKTRDPSIAKRLLRQANGHDDKKHLGLQLDRQLVRMHAKEHNKVGLPRKDVEAGTPG